MYFFFCWDMTEINVLLVQHQAPLSTMQDQPEPKEKLQPQNNQKLDVNPYLEWSIYLDWDLVPYTIVVEIRT